MAAVMFMSVMGSSLQAAAQTNVGEYTQAATAGDAVQNSTAGNAVQSSGTANVSSVNLMPIKEEETAVSEKENYTVEYHLDTEWNSGYNVTVTIRNTCDKIIDNWYLSFTLPDEIQNLQCAGMIQHEEGTYLVKNAGWNQDIPVGGSVSFTFTAAKSGDNVYPPQDYSMDIMEMDVPAEDYDRDFVIQSDWGTGFTSVLVITNTSEKPISDWRMSFEFAGSISSFNGGTIVRHDGMVYEVENMSWNQQIAPGQSLYLQIIGSRANANVVPMNISLRTVEYYALQEETPGTSLVFEDEEKTAELDRIRELNGGTLPLMYLDEEDCIPNFICGKYSDVKVNDYDSAVQSLHDVTNIMYIDWASTDFEGVSVNEYGGRRFYRLQQRYCKADVAGNHLIVATDMEGNITALSGNFDPLYGIAITPEIGEEEAAVIAFGLIGSEPEVQELMVYRTDECIDELVWHFLYGNRTIIINAVNGEVIADKCTDMGITGICEEGNAYRDGSYTGNVYVDITDGVVYARDDVRNMEMRAFNGNKADGGDRQISEAVVEKSTDAGWDISNIKFLMYTEQAHDFYNEVLGLDSFSNRHDDVVILRSIYEEGINNAISNIVNDSYEKFIYGYILYCDGMTANLETSVHEYSHLVQKYICNAEDGGNWLDTVYEAYSDVMAELADIRYYGYNEGTSWRNQFRDIVNRCNAEGKQYPINKSEINYKETNLTHKNSMVLSHAFYKMYIDGFNDMKTMSELIYRSIFYLNSDMKYEYVYPAIMQAAADMGLKEEQISIIKSTLVDAELENTIYNPDGHYKYNIIVTDFSSGFPVGNVVIKISDLNKNIYTDENAFRRFKSNDSGKAEFDVTMSRYRVRVQSEGYIDVMYYTDIIENPSNRIDIELIPVKYSGTENTISGTVTDVSTGKGVAGAIVKIRQGFEAKNGYRLYECVTGQDGSYSFSGVETGYYTIEAKKEGYVTEYLSTWSVPKEALEDEIIREVNYNICIYPYISDKEYRVVLEWNANPHDLDSHIEFTDGIGRYGHVYYSRKAYTMSDGSTVQLDVDDVTGYGPETVSFTVNSNDSYRYYVHWYGGTGTWQSSGAKVTVYCGNKAVGMYNVTQSGYVSGRKWNVFNIVNGRLEEAVQ